VRVVGRPVIVFHLLVFIASCSSPRHSSPRRAAGAGDRDGEPLGTRYRRAPAPAPRQRRGGGRPLTGARGSAPSHTSRRRARLHAPAPRPRARTPARALIDDAPPSPPRRVSSRLVWLQRTR